MLRVGIRSLRHPHAILSRPLRRSRALSLGPAHLYHLAYNTVKLANGLGSSPRQWTQTRTLLTHSYVKGPTHPPLDTRTLTDYYHEELLHKLPGNPALVCRSERAGPGVYGGPSSLSLEANLGRTDCLAWSFEELHAHADALAMGLSRMGVKPGDRVGVVMGNNRCAYSAGS